MIVTLFRKTQQNQPDKDQSFPGLRALGGPADGAVAQIVRGRYINNKGIE
jgi:hypothetical protein